MTFLNAQINHESLDSVTQIFFFLEHINQLRGLRLSYYLTVLLCILTMQHCRGNRQCRHCSTVYKCPLDFVRMNSNSWSRNDCMIMQNNKDQAYCITLKSLCQLNDHILRNLEK